MAVRRINMYGPNSLPQRYLGLSTDVKPTVGVPAGSTFIETDTKDRYLFDGNTWFFSKRGNRFAKISVNSFGAFAVGTLAVAKAINGKDCTVNVLSGNCWINPNATAVANATAIKLIPDAVLDINVTGNLSLISDAAGATVQIIVWGD